MHSTGGADVFVVPFRWHRKEFWPAACFCFCQTAWRPCFFLSFVCWLAHSIFPSLLSGVHLSFWRANFSSGVQKTVPPGRQGGGGKNKMKMACLFAAAATGFWRWCFLPPCVFSRGFVSHPFFTLYVTAVFNCSSNQGRVNNKRLVGTWVCCYYLWVYALGTLAVECTLATSPTESGRGRTNCIALHWETLVWHVINVFLCPCIVNNLPREG